MTYVEDDNGATVTEACMYHCAPGVPAACEGPACECDCHGDDLDRLIAEERRDPVFRAEYDRLAAEHARELDDRPADKLAAIAADVEREARQSDPTADYEQLRQERFRPPPRRHCRSCGAPVIWATTTRGKAMPVDADPVANGNLELSRTGEQINVRVVKESAGTHVSHYVTCPHANQWRPKRGAA